MKVEILYILDCPNLPPAVEMVKDVLREQGLPQEIHQIEVQNSRQAEALSFIGSPTVRVNGKDVEPNLSQPVSVGLSCRAYFVDGRVQGVPRREWIRDAIIAARSKE